MKKVLDYLRRASEESGKPAENNWYPDEGQDLDRTQKPYTPKDPKDVRRYKPID